MFLIAWAGLVAAVLYTNLSLLGWFPVWPLLPFLTTFAILWEMVFNAIGLSAKYRRIHQERQQAQLQALEVAGLSRLVRVVCHDISNPLMAIELVAGKLRKEMGTPSPEGRIPHLLSRLGESTAAISAIIKDVRMLERLRLEGGSVPVERLDPLEAVEESLAALHEDIERKQLTIERGRPPETRFALANRGYLVRNVLANILTNAVKFSPAGGRILVAVEGGADHVDIRCSDQGAGMPEETRLAIERSLPVKSTPGTRGEGGTGFGLQLARDFTRAMGGQLIIRTRQGDDGQPSQGTTVIIRLRAA
jgi:signal transduction histidine kinase